MAHDGRHNAESKHEETLRYQMEFLIRFIYMRFYTAFFNETAM